MSIVRLSYWTRRTHTNTAAAQERLDPDTRCRRSTSPSLSFSLSLSLPLSLSLFLALLAWTECDADRLFLRSLSLPSRCGNGISFAGLLEIMKPAQLCSANYPCTLHAVCLL
ncbi:unnamed protein product [Protopolystoma xenopodis]|uniref:Uncharacterized protein n=1 Tax=Protopolystoma xenopodis TaxID=117903 RepID=A0A3S5AHV2_9PLAT|nr:unnamed protein product [Protopolystoma xenopodis]